MRKDNKQARDRQIFDLWLACHTQQEIADEVGLSQSEVDRCFTQFGNIAILGKTDQSSAAHATEFDVPLYNVGRHRSTPPYTYRKRRVKGSDGRRNLARPSEQVGKPAAAPSSSGDSGWPGNGQTRSPAGVSQRCSNAAGSPPLVARAAPCAVSKKRQRTAA